MSFASNNPSSARALKIPELACIISELAGKQDAARLGCTCWELFYSYMPLAWQHVLHVSQVLSLVRGVQISIVYNEQISSEEEGEKMTIRLPDGVHGGDLIRLRFYAPFIKKLDINGWRTRRYLLLNWRSTLEYANKHTLLPNLISITFASLRFEGDLHYVWLCMFASPALREFAMTIQAWEEMPQMTVPVAAALYKKLFGQCPDLERLKLFPYTLLEYTDELPLLESSWRQINARTGYGSRLTEMSITSLALSILTEQGSPPLPVLEQLCIHDYYFQDGTSTSSTSTQNLFPNLRKLSVLGLAHEAVLRRIWSVLGSVLGQLTHIKLEFLPKYWDQGRSATILEEISFLVIHSPQVVDLCLETTYSYGGWNRAIPASKVIALLNKLRLERLCILGAHLNDFLPHNSQLGQLKSLELPNHRVNIYDLQQFANAMPLLEYLSLDLQFDHNTKRPNDNITLGSTALQRLESNFYQIPEDTSVHHIARRLPKFEGEHYTSALEFARLLYSLWPNVQLIPRYNTDRSEWAPTIPVHAPTIRVVLLISAQLSALARLNKELNSGYVNFDSVDVMNKDSWMACYC